MGVGNLDIPPMTDTQRKMFDDNIRLAYYAAGQMLRKGKIPFGFSLDECSGIGMLTLWRATQTYNPDKGTQFSTYFCNAFWKNWYRYLRASEQTQMGFNKNIAMMFHMGLIPQWFDRDECKEEKVENNTIYENLLGYMKKQLTPRDYIIIKGMFIDNRTLESMGQELGLTKERIRQLKVRALTKLDYEKMLQIKEGFLDEYCRTPEEDASLSVGEHQGCGEGVCVQDEEEISSHQSKRTHQHCLGCV